ncbi:DUF4403 family protein [Chitinophaga sp. LS1]|uniref:DUF4403 family protein n=1 Tax=Chitinophaga sp. LS1 TaxID=3051176 RepID=UPI002AAB959A|nr:DUF4403 family protein [Chitinophaga sp. LS1]WPV65948.1 DUF4403 family protein [Chitinophaga sp. LS1]
MNLTIWLFLPLIFTVSTGCKSYKEITKKPDRLHQEVEIPTFESRFVLALKIDLSTLENHINDAFKNSYSNTDEGTYEYKSWIKTKDPLYNPNEAIVTKDLLYNPNKWLKTKDPLYNSKKWIKKWGFKTKNPLYHPNKWLETKDPLYHPNEWISTNNPLYHPNEWIETKGPSVAVGYRYDYVLDLKERIKLSYVDDNTLRVVAPISFKGTVGFQGALPANLTLNKKNFDGVIEFLVDTHISMTPDWCPKIEAVVTHNWLSNPQVEIMDNIYISITSVTNKILKKVEENVNETISKEIKCESVRDVIKERWKYYGFKLPALANGKHYHLNINPTSAALSTLKVYKDTLALYVGIKANISLNDEIVNTTKIIPILEEQIEAPSEIKVFVPLVIKYDDIKSSANKYFKENNIVLSPNLILNKKAKIKLRKMDIYPNGDEVVVGVNIKAYLPGNVLPVSGWVYLTGKPVMTGGRKFELEDLDFSMNVDNKFYSVISTIFKPLIINEIKKQTTRDLTNSIESIKKMLFEKIGTYQQERIGLSIYNFDIGVYDIALTKEGIAIVVELNSTFNVSMKN